MTDRLAKSCANDDHLPDSAARRSDCASPYCLECFSTLCVACEATAVPQRALSLCDECSLDASMAIDEIIAAEVGQRGIQADQPSRPNNSSGPWSDDEEQRLLLSYRSGRSVPAIGRQHGRSVGAIWSRLVKTREVSWSQVPKSSRSYKGT